MHIEEISHKQMQRHLIAMRALHSVVARSILEDQVIDTLLDRSRMKYSELCMLFVPLWLYLSYRSFVMSTVQDIF
jgi:hypothetical protein